VSAPEHFAERHGTIILPFVALALAVTSGHSARAAFAVSLNAA
jgi:hypothetical protein